MMKKQNHKDKYKTDYQEQSEHGGHYYRKFRTSKQNKANNALDRALRQRDFARIRDDDEQYDYY